MQEVTAEQLWPLVEQSQSLALFVYTPMCGTCKLAERMLTIACEALPTKVAVYKININTAPRLARQWAISSVPALLLFREGELCERHYAMQSVGFLFEQLQKWK